MREGTTGQWTVRANVASGHCYIGVAADGFDPTVEIATNKDLWGSKVSVAHGVRHFHAGQEQESAELDVDFPLELVMTVDKGDRKMQ